MFIASLIVLVLGLFGFGYFDDKKAQVALACIYVGLFWFVYALGVWFAGHPVDVPGV